MLNTLKMAGQALVYSYHLSLKSLSHIKEYPSDFLGPKGDYDAG